MQGKEIPQLQKITGKVWKKEDELKQLKSELVSLERKIQSKLTPPHRKSMKQRRMGEKSRAD